MKKLLTLTALICGLWTMDHGLIYAQNVGVDVATPVEKLDVLGAIRIGTTSNTNAGTIRYNTPNFEGYNGSAWVNFGGGTVTGSGTATRVAFWSGTSALSSSANLYWNDVNSRLGIGTATPGAPLHVYQSGTAGGGWFQINNTGSSNTALIASNNGNGETFYAVNNGWGRAATFEINNTSSDRYAIYATTNGVGPAIFADKAGSTGNALKLQTGVSSNSSPTLYSNTFGTGYAGEFRIDNSGSSSAALYASTSGTGPAIEASGKTKTTTFQMTSSPTVNYVLRSDATGNATWVNPNTLVTGLLPAGTTTQTLRHDGTNWVANSVMVNNGTNVGIGTTSPDFKLHVLGSDYLTLKVAAPANPLLKLSGSYNSGNGAEFWQDAAGDARLNINGAINAIYMKATGDIGIGITFPSVPAARLDVNNGTSTVPIFLARDNGTEVMRIADGGNVGIGTTAPSEKLDVWGNLDLSAVQPVLKFSAIGTPRNSNITTTFSPTTLVGQTMRINLSDNTNTGVTEIMRLQGDGTVGIGVNSPTSYLDIKGTGDDAASTSLKLRSGNAGLGTLSNQIVFGFDGGVIQQHAIKTRHHSSQDARNSIDFYVWDFGTDASGSVGTKRVMTIDGNGNGMVGIGVLEPLDELHVVGNIRMVDGNQAVGYVPVSDANGTMTWTNPSTIVGGQAWKLTGNASTVDGTNFIGTTDDVPLNIKVNGQKAGRIDRVKFNSFWGYQAGNLNATGTDNTAIGYTALASTTGGSFNTAIGSNSLLNTTGSNNSAVGADAMITNTTGYDNTASGYRALYSNIDGYENTVTGKRAMFSNNSGYQNTANGNLALTTNTTGSNNTALGYAADVSTGALTNATAIGNGAIVNASNKVQIGNGFLTAVQLGTGTNVTLETGLVKITGGTPAAGQVLTSTDATGIATWEPVPGDNLGNHTATTNIQLNSNWLSNDGSSEGIRVDNSGNVGVGIAPSGNAYLDITGTNGGTNSLQLRSGNSQLSPTLSNQILFGYNGTEDYRHAIKTRHNSGGAANNAIDFYVWKSGTDAVGTVGTQQVMTIDGGNGGSVGIGTTAPGAKLEVAGTVKATALAGAFDQSASGYSRIGNMQIAWGTITLASGQAWSNAGDLSYVLASQSITFPASFNATPSVTFSQIDGQIAARSAYVSYHVPATTGVTSIYLSSPDPNHTETGGVIVYWMAIGTWQ